ncbi:hypothetical protein Ngar_c13550 [Candidatus Nitrososphaera gargensis Ga9.2]|uniref:Uncharacterized protein n=1 Tax=Nitrososphaera gargensis (strain Ga9.2) TaxID=1237085 RepID=K0IHC0_NITGG|nr:hypothetical protein [Candidatus Nitrososphaera gargensis]AFU58293.1 hypothetical protein Ngar_c13550 [Candidatus Nitrososphaera gargensis Ga9.2]
MVVTTSTIDATAAPVIITRTEVSESDVVSEPGDLFTLRYNRIKEEARAEVARAYKITARPAMTTNLRHGQVGPCVWCGAVATLEILLHYRSHLAEEWRHIWTVNNDGWFTWIVVEKHCDSCARRHYPETMTTSLEDLK